MNIVETVILCIFVTWVVMVTFIFYLAFFYRSPFREEDIGLSQLRNNKSK